MKQNKPILHARDHLPGGADPIPGLPAPPPPGAPPTHVDPPTTTKPQEGEKHPDEHWYWWPCRDWERVFVSSGEPYRVDTPEVNYDDPLNVMHVTWQDMSFTDHTNEVTGGHIGPNPDSASLLRLRVITRNPDNFFIASASATFNAQVGGEFTLLGWFNFVALENWDIINLTKAAAPIDRSTWLLLNPDGSVTLHRDSTEFTSAAGLIQAGVWVYIGISLGHGRIRVYVNPGPPEPTAYSPVWGTSFPFDGPMAMETWGLALGDYTADQLANRLTSNGFKSVALRLNPPPEELPPGMTHAAYITQMTADVATLQAAGVQVVGWGPADATSGADLAATGVTGWMPQIETSGQYSAAVAQLTAGAGAGLPKAVVWTEGGINSSSQVTTLNGLGVTGYAAETYAEAGGPFTNAGGPIWQGTQFGMTEAQSIPMLGTYRGETPDDYTGFDETIIPNYGIYNIPQTSESGWAAFRELNQGTLMLSSPVIDEADPSTVTGAHGIHIGGAASSGWTTHGADGAFEGYFSEITLYQHAVPSSGHRSLYLSDKTGGGSVPVQDQIPAGSITPSQIQAGTDGQHLVTDSGTVHWATDTGGGTTSTGIWRWTTGTTDAATSGRVGLNTASWATATQVHLNKTTQAGVDATNLLALLQSGDGLYLQEQASAGNWGRYSITGAGTDNGSWWSFPVTLVSSGGVPPANNADATVSLLLQGSTGGGATDLDYHGDYPTDTPYVDGDIVVYGGVPYICVTPTSSPPIPWPKLTTTYAAVKASYSTYAALLAGNSSYADVIGSTAATPDPATTKWVPLSGLQGETGPPGPAGPGGGGSDIQTFTSSGTWTKPAGVKVVHVICIGAGGGGSAGFSNQGANARAGGAGGGGGAYWEETFRADDLTDTVTVTVGVGGNGGAAVASAAGGGGIVGGTSSFGAYAKACGGGNGSVAAGAGGGGGTYLNPGANQTAGAPAAGTTALGNQGAGGPLSGAGGNSELGGAGGGAGGLAGGSSSRGGSGGGGGGGHTATPAVNQPAAGGLAGAYTTGNGGTAGTSGPSPTAGGAGGTVTGRLCGSGGGGGGSTVTAATTAGKGGDGGLGSGGGGGGSSSGSLAGAGGRGGDGLMIVMSW